MPTAPLVCHVLLVETDNGLVLVDSGFGSHDCRRPRKRVGPTRHVVRPLFDHVETAARQIERLGFRAGRRAPHRHHASRRGPHRRPFRLPGRPDPRHRRRSARSNQGAVAWREKIRYRPAQWAHKPNIVEHHPHGEKWRGFAAAKELDEISPGIALISLPGHTRGHACVAVDAGHRWVLHCGDAFYHYGTLDGQSRVPRILTTMESFIALDLKKVRDNHARLAELYQRQDPDLFIVCSHDPTLYERAHATAKKRKKKSEADCCPRRDRCDRQGVGQPGTRSRPHRCGRRTAAGRCRATNHGRPAIRRTDAPFR